MRLEKERHLLRKSVAPLLLGLAGLAGLLAAALLTELALPLLIIAGVAAAIHFLAPRPPSRPG